MGRTVLACRQEPSCFASARLHLYLNTTNFRCDTSLSVFSRSRYTPAATGRPRKSVPLPGLKFQVIAFTVQAAGGPKIYAGRAMKESHAHLNISAREWDAMLADLRASLFRYNVPDREQKELIDLVNSIKGDIVTASN